MDQTETKLKVGDVVTLKDGRKVQLEINPLHHLGIEDYKSDCQQCSLQARECITPGFLGCCQAPKGTYFKWVDENDAENIQVNDAREVQVTEERQPSDLD